MMTTIIFYDKADLESAIKVVFLIVAKMAEDRGLSKYQVNSRFAPDSLACVLVSLLPESRKTSLRAGAVALPLDLSLRALVFCFFGQHPVCIFLLRKQP